MRTVESTSAKHAPGGLVVSAPLGTMPVLVELLVQLFAVGTRFVPPTARRVLVPGDLPPALERVALQAQRELQAWVAWTDETRTWFVIAEMAEIPDPHGQSGAIRMFFHDEDGRQVSWGTWALQSERNWMLCEH